MYKLLFDSDALIKISKAEFLDVIVKNFNASIAEEVYEEAVKEGKKGFYPDADKIGNFIQEGKIKIIKKQYYNKGKKTKQPFGRGEASVFQAYKKGNIIVSDDLSFTSYARKENIKSLSSAHLIYVLVKKRKISKDKAYDSLEKLKPYIRKDVYELVKKDIGE